MDQNRIIKVVDDNGNEKEKEYIVCLQINMYICRQEYWSG